MSITKIKLSKFTAFEKIEIDFSPGINVLIGENGTGKTHLLKILYAACDTGSKKKEGAKTDFLEKLIRVFLPSGNKIARLLNRRVGRMRGSVEVESKGAKLRLAFTNLLKSADKAEVSGYDAWCRQELESVYIPVKEMLANAPGFISLYEKFDIHFEEVYKDILIRAYKPTPRGPKDAHCRALMDTLSNAMEGKVALEGQEFFLKDAQGRLEFTLLAEGMRKLGLLWILIQNGTLVNGSVLFWDEPESNLNPKAISTVVDILVKLQRIGVQIFIATHDYFILRKLDLLMDKGDKVLFHSLYRDGNKEILCRSYKTFAEIEPNAIMDTFDVLYDAEIQRTLGPITKK